MKGHLDYDKLPNLIENAFYIYPILSFFFIYYTTKTALSLTLFILSFLVFAVLVALDRYYKEKRHKFNTNKQKTETILKVKRNPVARVLTVQLILYFLAVVYIYFYSATLEGLLLLNGVWGQGIL